MQVKPVDYTSHFQAYNCKMYKLPKEAERLLSSHEIEIINEYGLPDRALPFFHFDLHLHFLRDFKNPESKMIIGSGNYPASEEYILLHKNGGVYFKENNLPLNYINGSIEQLIDSIYAYSKWLENLEVNGDIMQRYEVTEEDIFDVYYTLRAIDRMALIGDHIWNCLIQFDKAKREIIASSSL